MTIYRPFSLAFRSAIKLQKIFEIITAAPLGGRQDVDCATLNCRFSYPNPYLGKGGVMPQLRRLFPPPVASLPELRCRCRDQRRHDARTQTPEAAPDGCIIWPRPGIMPMALPHPTPRRRARRFIAGVASVPEPARPMSRAASCGSAVHRDGRYNAPPEGACPRSFWTSIDQTLEPAAPTGRNLAEVVLTIVN